MTPPKLEDLLALVLGELSAPARASLERHIAADPALVRELRVLHELLGSAAAHLAPAPASATGRQALLAALDSGARYRPFAAEVARHFDLPITEMRALLDTIDDEARWERGRMPGVRLLHVQGGPAVAARDVGFVWLHRGVVTPYHHHVEPEVVYVLEGSLRDSDGVLYLPGEAMLMAPGTEHDLRAGEDADTLFAAVLGKTRRATPPQSS
jgi:anti-sigma factor ChrR (cupin superfamily)